MPSASRKAKAVWLIGGIGKRIIAAADGGGGGGGAAVAVGIKYGAGWLIANGTISVKNLNNNIRSVVNKICLKNIQILFSF